MVLGFYIGDIYGTLMWRYAIQSDVGLVLREETSTREENLETTSF